ncbi:DUF4115 domain-containing protein [Pigmentiphaga aceris]|uniref:DUF4115 domain-containing protein n=1 Tax=Pigmentiphaga aceris TaxID=1940612 RepID=A0A5C0AUK0_9BURK|nr:helix-turn-helix domain-containing protein [Pigmentiphaga aceris]QEI05988.1 DUF4115 domain-containing protein [Pigmentiphaga aceris]
MTYPGDNATAPGAADAFSSVGHALRELRTQRGWSIFDVSARLKFAPRQIEALENEEWSELPRGSSLRGFLRNYARLLEIDPEPLLTAVEGPAHAAAAPRVTDAVASAVAAVSSAVPVSSSRRRSTIGQQRRRGVGVFSIVLVLIAAGAAYAVVQERLPEQWRIARMLRNDNGNAITPPATISGAPGTISSNAPIAAANQPEVRVPHPLEPAPAANGSATPSSSSGTSTTTTTTTVIPPLSPTANTSLTPAAPTPAPGAITPPATTPAPTAALVTPPAATPASPAATAAATAAPRAAAPAGSSPLVLRVVNDSWVELKATNGTLVSKVLPAGSEHSFDVVPPGRLVVGNAGGATVSWQGKPMDVRSAQRDNVARLTLQ